MPSDRDAHFNASRPDGLEAALSALATLHDDARLVRDGIMAPSALASSMREAEDAIAWLRTEAAKRAGLDKSTPPCAWMHPDGRVVPASTMEAARKDGGAMLTSLGSYSVPLYPPEAGAVRTPHPSHGWTDADADAARLALELECLLNDKDLPVVSVSRWWASAHEALDLHRQRIAAVPGHPLQSANPKSVMRLTNDDIDKLNRRTQMPDGSLSRVGDRQWLEMFRIVARSVESEILQRLTDGAPEAPTPTEPQPDEEIDLSDIPELDAKFFDGATLTRPGEKLIDPKTLTRHGPHSAVAFARAVEAQAVRFDMALMAQALEALRNVPEVGSTWDAQHADHHMQVDMALSARLRQISGELDSSTHAASAADPVSPVNRPSIR